MSQAAGQKLGLMSRLGIALKTVIGLTPDAALFFGSGGVTKGKSTRPYNQVAAVFACVQARADAVALMRLTICDANDNVIETGPLADMVYRPSPKVTGRSLWRATEAYLCIFGRCYWHKTLLNGRPIHGEVRSPLEIEPVIGPSGDVIYYYYSPNGVGTPQRLELDEIHELVEPDYESADPTDATGPRQAVTAAINQYYKSDVANETSLDNDVQPGGVITYPDGATEAQKTELREEIQARHAGAANRRRIMVLTGTATWAPMQSAFKDMEFSVLKNFSREDICAGYRVPPSVAGYYTDSNYAHAQASQVMFWDNTIIPRGVWLAEEWEMAFVTPFDNVKTLSLSQAKTRKLSIRELRSQSRNEAAWRAKSGQKRFYAYFDASHIPAVQQGQLALASTALVWMKAGVPLNDLIKAHNLPYEEKPWGNTWWRDMGLVDVTDPDIMPGSDDPDGSGEGGNDDADGNLDNNQDETEITQEAADRYVQRTAEIRRVYDMWRASWAPIERETRKKISGHFMGLRAEVLANLEKALPENKAYEPSQKRDIIGTILFDLVKANQKLLVKVGPLMRAAHHLGGQQSMDEAADAQGKESSPYNIENPQAIAAMRQREIMLTGANRTLRNQLSESLADGIEKQETIKDLAERIRTQFGYATTRATTIARTEVGAAVEQARQLGRVQAGVPLKSWLWSHREKGRSWHFAIEQATMEKPISVDDVFVSGKTGKTAKHPRDFKTPVEDVNCGCTTLSRFHGDSVKTVIARLSTRGFTTISQLQQRFYNGKEAA